jgi:hypothetical protein
MMNLQLSTPQAEELERVLTSTLGDLSFEIAGTDNATFRAELMARRNLLREVLDALHGGTAWSEPAGEAPDALTRELARPGD